MMLQKSQPNTSHYQLSSKPQLDQILFHSFTQTLPRIEDKLMPSIHKPVCNTVLNPGVQVEPLLVFQEFQDQEHIDLVKPLSVINAEREE
jgi:hypothetical protein